MPDRIIRLTRRVLIEEHSGWLHREDVPPVLHVLFDDDVEIDWLTDEQQEALDELLGTGDALSLGDTIESTPFEIDQYEEENP